jgi:hypothetical protein
LRERERRERREREEVDKMAEELDVDEMLEAAFNNKSVRGLQPMYFNF